jgi:hypothetical protein
LILLALIVAPAAFSQTQTVMFEWGALHAQQSQVLALNVSLGEDCSGLSVPATLERYDRAGNLIAQASVTLTTGQTITFAVGPKNAMVQNAIGAYAYLVLPPETHLILPCIKLAFPPGPCRAPTDLLTPTMETLDASSGRLMSFANNPHTLVN